MHSNWQKGDVLVGRYELRDIVGAGAGGKIWMALDRNLGGRSTAIKFYEPDTLIADLAEHVRTGTLKRDVYEAELKNILQRFRQEAIRISRLDHPSIVQVFDYVDKEYAAFRGDQEMLRADPFMAMEFIKGRTLEEMLTKQAVSLADALQIGAQVADGLAYAHSQNLVHRDLKPSNIMVEEAIGQLRVRIIDWGVAKVVADEAQANMTRLMATTDLSQTSDNIHTRGILLGTPKFIAPEHFKAGGAKWGPASDVFALGMMLFRMVTKRPVRRESFIGECLTQSDRDLLKGACVKVPELEQIVLLCLSEIREERMSAAAVRDSLRRIHDRLELGTIQPGEPEPTAVMTVQPLTPLGEKMPSTEVSAAPSSSSTPVVEEVVVYRGVSWAVAVLLLIVGLGGGGAAGWVVHAGQKAPPATDEVAVVIRPGEPATFHGDPPKEGVPAKTPAGGGPAVPAAPTEPTDEQKAKILAEAGVDPTFKPIKVKVTSDPVAQVELRDPDGTKIVGSTPVDLVLRNRYEMRVLKLSAEEHRDLTETIYALDVVDNPPDDDGVRTVHMTLHPVIKDITDEKQNPYLKKFQNSFDKELPGP
ncbi:MAG: hypothetical protein AMXMBFR64_48800 [Myxococcales bacterium]